MNDDDLRVGPSTDVPAMSRLHAAGFPDEPWSVPALVGILTTSGTRVFAAAAGGAMSGFIVVRTVADEAEIITVCVAESARRRGVGGRLLATAVAAAAADGAQAVFLEAADDNPAAQALYRAAGFITVGRRRGYYRRGAETADALVMKLSLPKQI